MIFIWSLSPIGDQSILHILYTSVQPTSTASSVAYINSRQQSYSTPDLSSSFPQQWFNSLAIEMGSMLIAPTKVKNSTMDINGNV